MTTPEVQLWVSDNLETQETAAAILELIEIDLEIAAELGGVDVY